MSAASRLESRVASWLIDLPRQLPWPRLAKHRQASRNEGALLGWLRFFNPCHWRCIAWTLQSQLHPSVIMYIGRGGPLFAPSMHHQYSGWVGVSTLWETKVKRKKIIWQQKERKKKENDQDPMQEKKDKKIFKAGVGKLIENKTCWQETNLNNFAKY